MNKTALITGITGQDGAYLAELLLGQGYVVHGIKRRSSLFNTQRVDHLYQDPHTDDRRFILHHGDLTDATNLIRIIQQVQPDEIYNLAAQSHVQVSFETPEYTANVDALGTLRLLEGLHLVLRTHAELDLLDQAATARFFAEERPEAVFLAAARVGGIQANHQYRGEFIYENLQVQVNVLHQAYRAGVRRLIFLGSSCIYPKFAPQPISEDALLTGPLEPTNAPYAIAKIAGVEMCDAYNRQYGTAYVPVMPTNLYGPNDNFDLETSHALPALIRKFHLAKLAQAGDWAGIARDAARYGPIPADLQQSLGIPPYSPVTPCVLLWGTGTPRREFLHVDDLAADCVHIGLHTDATRLLNIGAGGM